MIRDRSRAVGVAIVGFVVFVALTTYVADRRLPPGPITRVDSWLREYPGSTRYSFAMGINWLGSAPAVATLSLGLAVFSWCVLHRRGLAVLLVAAPALAGIAQALTRLAIERPLSHRSELLGAYGHGFPSGHTTGSAALAAAVVVGAWSMSELNRHRLVAVSASYALAVALSCIVIGAHRGLDVVGGLVLGLLVVLVLAIAARGVRDQESRVRP
jgi:membrane-associated phospholipid phosphatase